jgi:hypothetical protein
VTCAELYAHTVLKERKKLMSVAAMTVIIIFTLLYSIANIND